MKKAIAVIALLVAVIYSCQQSELLISAAYNTILNSSELPSQHFTVDLSKDTTLLTAKRAVIKIPKGSLDAGGATTVTLEVKEAYSIQDIIKGGLTTTSNGSPLSSGGMIYINPIAGSSAKIIKPLFVAMPSPTLDSAMQLYKGDIKPDSTINWTAPTPLPANPQLARLQTGERIFAANCAPCHAVNNDLTGPALAGAVERAPHYRHLSGVQGDTSLRSLLYEFTRNNSQVLASGECYYNRLYESWHQVPMSNFPNLTDEDLDNLYAWIKSATTVPVLSTVNDMSPCYDSCQLYLELKRDLTATKRKLEKDSVLLEAIELDMTPTSPITLKADTTPPELDKVQPLESKSLYYQFNITAFGWYNIDKLYKYDDRTLIVRMQGQYKVSFNLYFLLPSHKVFLTGGPLKNNKDAYGFDSADGSIPLPEGETGFVFAVGEHDDSIFFASTSFTTQNVNEITLTLAQTSKEAFELAIKKVGLPDFSATVNETPNAAPLREVIKQLKSAETLKPKHCDCDCLIKLSVKTTPSPGIEIRERSINANSNNIAIPQDFARGQNRTKADNYKYNDSAMAL